ncbi:MAG: cytochrome P450 [Solirubrobacterales bacterium]
MNLQERVRLDSPEFFASRPEAALAALRDEAPVYRDEHTGCWLLSRHDDVLWAFRNPDLFASRFGTSPEEHENPGWVYEHTVTGSEFLLLTDPPAHTALRALFSPAFTRAAFEAWEVNLRKTVATILDGLPVGEEFDGYTELARQVSLLSICDFVGIPREDADWVKGATAAWSPAPTLPAAPPSAFAADMSLEEYFAFLLAERAREPREDLLSVIATAEGGPSTLATKLMFCIDVFVAGDEPTADAIAGGFEALIADPSQAELLFGTLDIVPGAVEEILRWSSPIPVMCRTTVGDIEVRGQTIPADSYVYLMLFSANRDEDVWESAGRFEVTRPGAAKNVTFGRNAHACIGAGIVRRTLRVLFEEFIPRFRTVSGTGPVVRNRSVHMPFIRELPMRLER